MGKVKPFLGTFRLNKAKGSRYLNVPATVPDGDAEGALPLDRQVWITVEEIPQPKSTDEVEPKDE